MSDRAAGAPLGSAVLAAFAAPQIALAALYTPVFVYLAPFYSEARGLDLPLIAALLIAARAIDAVSDPVMGWISDRLRPPLGRRKFWLAASTPLVCLSAWMLFAPPETAGPFYLAGWLIALTLSWTVALTPYFAWGAEIADDYAGRARAAAWREGAFLVGTLAAALLYALGPGLIGDPEGGAEAGLRAVALFVVVSLPVFALLAIVLAPEPRDRSRPGVPGGALGEGLRDGLRAMVRNGPFRRLIGSYFVNSCANALPAALFLFYCQYVLEADQETTGLLFVAYLVSAVLAAPAWSWLARRYDKHRVWCVAMLYACAIFSIAPFLGPGDVAIFLAVSVLTGIAFGADVILPTAMNADVVDVDTAETGVQRTGLYFAAWSVCFKLASGLAAGGGVYTLSRIGFDPAQGAQSPEALAALAWIYAGAPIVLKLAAVAMMWRFPLGAAAQAALRDRIESGAAAA